MYSRVIQFCVVVIVQSSSHIWLCNRMQHARPPCPSPSPGVCPSSRSVLWWCHPAISPSDVFFFFCPQFFPASGTCPVGRLIASGDQNAQALASASVLPVSIQGWFPLRLTGLHIYIYIYIFFRFFSIIGYYKISNTVSCAIQQILVVQSLYSFDYCSFLPQHILSRICSRDIYLGNQGRKKVPLVEVGVE